MNHHNFSLKELKQLDMVDWLERLGHSPRKISGNDYWYLSPLRNEKEASFKVNRKLNAWYDHGLSKGGNIIDFGILYHGCTIKEFMERMAGNNFSFHQPVTRLDNPLNDEATGKIKILELRSIQSPDLLDYLKERMIPLNIADTHCREVHYEVHGKKYSAIGFENNSGGFELRNRYFKGSSSPKDSTLIRKEGAPALTVIEGFFSFLSLLTSNQSQQPTDFLVLNSLSFIEKNMGRMQSYPETRLLLDNDEAGDNATSKLLTRSSIFKDYRELYKGFKDCNHWLTENHGSIKKSQVLENKESFSSQRLRTGRRIH